MQAAMRSDSMPVVLLVKAVEEADQTHSVLPLADREHATRETLRALGFSTAELEAQGSERRLVRALTDRAGRLADVLGRRYPVVHELEGSVRWPGWLSVVLLLGAFALGVVLSALDETRRINILAFPFLGVIAWNLLMYLVLIATWLRRARGLTGRAVRPATGQGLAAIATRLVARPLRALARKTAEVHATLGRAVESFVGEWSRYAAPLTGSRSRRLLHLGSVAVALGLISGLYFRGIVFQYEAGWESTFLGPSQVRDVLGVLFGPAARWSGVALPATAEAVAALRWDAPGGGGDAAPWIHLIAVTLLIYVVVPRLLLAVAAGLQEWRLRRASAVPASLLSYARRAFGAAGRGLRSAAVAVTAYAYEPPARALAALQQMLATRLGGGVRLAMQPLLHYGEEAAAGRAVAGGDVPPADAQVLLFSLGATPESENHGLVVAAVRDAVQRARPAPELLVVVDEAPYAVRLGSDASLEPRLEERRELWRRFLAGYGLEATFLAEMGQV
jgi:Protein of unknown function (DUF2868)